MASLSLVELNYGLNVISYKYLKILVCNLCYVLMLIDNV